MEIAKLREQLKNAEDRASSLEELANYHKQHLSDAEWRYQELMQQLNLSQESHLALIRSLPAAITEPTVPDKALGRRRRWWPFGRK